MSCVVRPGRLPAQSVISNIRLYGLPDRGVGPLVRLSLSPSSVRERTLLPGPDLLIVCHSTTGTLRGLCQVD